MSGRLWAPFIQASPKGIILIILLSFIITPTFAENALATTGSPKETGLVRFNRIICTDTGLCLLFYHRVLTIGDVGQVNGPYVKAVYVTPSGEITTSALSINLSMNANISFDIVHNYMDVQEIQEEGDVFRLIGYNEDYRTLYEIWYFKHNNSLLVKEKALGAVGEWGYECLHQWPIVKQLTNYTLVGLIWPHQMIKVNFHSFERIYIPAEYSPVREIPDLHLFDGNNSFYAFDYEPYNILYIQRLFLNGSEAYHLREDLVPTNRRWGSLLKGKDGNLYFGIRCLDPNWEDFTLKHYNHTFYLVNIVAKQILSHSFTTPDHSYRWDVLIDSEGCPHMIINTYVTQYLKFTSSGVLSIQSTLAFPETGRFHIPHENFALYQNKYLVGGLYKENKNAGLFVIDVNTGKIVSVNASLLPYIDYPHGFFISFEFFPLGIFSLFLLHVVLRKKRKE